MRRGQRRWVLTLMLTLLGGAGLGAETMDLAGDWRFELDRNDRGVSESWSRRTLPETLHLPGLLTAQGYGDPVSMETRWTGNLRREWFEDPYYRQYQDPGAFKMPFWLQPDRHYVGAVWYQREVVVPASWSGQRVVLFLERPHWETTLWLDGREVGRRRYLSVPHVYDLGVGVSPGRHRLTIRVDNRMVVNVGPNSHSVSDHTQGNWNGIVGRLELRATDPVWIERVRVDPNGMTGRHGVTLWVGNLTAAPVTVTAAAALNGVPAAQTTVRVAAEGGVVTLELAPQTALARWDEFRPRLHDLDVTLRAEGQVRDRASLRFGVRDVSTRGTRITLNGRPLFLRGTLECCIFPRAGHPPTEVGPWKRIIRICQAHGLNHIRFHSWCPPEAAFVAADELGFYYQVECSSWANQGAAVGDGGDFDAWLNEEAAAILAAYGNHPSFLLMAYGNEPAGKRHREFLARFVKRWRHEDPRRLYTPAAGWPILAGSDYHNAPGPRIQQWGQGLQSVINGQAPRTDYDWAGWVHDHNDAPTISHEIGQWCVYPNLDERAKYTGLLKARNFDIFEDQLQRHGLRHQARDFLLASGKLQTLCYKAEIEAALRTPGFGGFQLLDLHDFPGQGTALVGVLDPFWDEKGYVTAAQYRRFAGPIVPLARLSRRVFEIGDRLRVPVQLAQFGPTDLVDVTPVWALRSDDGRVLYRGELARGTVRTGTLTDLGMIETTLTDLSVPAHVTLTVAVPGTEAANDWGLWVYPRAPRAGSAAVRVTRILDEATRRTLEQGGAVLWSPPAALVRDDPKHPIRMGFSSIFWNTVWTGRQAPHTLGILCDPNHPALAAFPTASHSDWQWWDLVHDRQPFLLTDLRELQPIVQVIDDWVTARKLGLVFEARVGRGTLLACAADLVTDLEHRPVARQMRASLLAYLSSGRCRPALSLAWDRVAGLCRQPGFLETVEARATADDHQPGYEPARAIDGNPQTLWHTSWSPAAPLPHWFQLDLGARRPVAGLTYRPRADGSNGRIAAYRIAVSDDGRHWGAPVASGTWPDNARTKTVRFAAPQRARYVRLTALSEVRGQAYASAAEIDLLTE